MFTSNSHQAKQYANAFDFIRNTTGILPYSAVCESEEQAEYLKSLEGNVLYDFLRELQVDYLLAPIPIDNLLFHHTSTENVESILRCGINPSIEDGDSSLSCGSGIYCTQLKDFDPNHIHDFDKAINFLSKRTIILFKSPLPVYKIVYSTCDTKDYENECIIPVDSESDIILPESIIDVTDIRNLGVQTETNNQLKSFA